MKTINDFIKELQSISETNRNLPLVIYCPNGLEVSPVIKRGYDNPTYDFLTKPPTKMVITYD